MFPESRMREIRPSGLMRGGSWLTHLGQLLPTLPPVYHAAKAPELAASVKSQYVSASMKTNNHE
jgi:hypothetical protein